MNTEFIQRRASLGNSQLKEGMNLDSNNKVETARTTVEQVRSKLRDKQREQGEHEAQAATLRSAWRELCLRDATEQEDLSDEIAANESEQADLERIGERIALAIGALERSLAAAEEELAMQLEEAGTTLHRVQYLEALAAFGQRRDDSELLRAEMNEKLLAARDVIEQYIALHNELQRTRYNLFKQAHAHRYPVPPTLDSQLPLPLQGSRRWWEYIE